MTVRRSERLVTDALQKLIESAISTLMSLLWAADYDEFICCPTKKIGIKTVSP